jgi:hypothetical protein
VRLAHRNLPRPCRVARIPVIDETDEVLPSRLRPRSCAGHGGTTIELGSRADELQTQAGPRRVFEDMELRNDYVSLSSSP